MEIAERFVSGTIVALLKGKMEADTVPMFERWFDAHMESSIDRIVLDLSGLSYISSAGLRAILAAAKQLKGQRGLAICGLYGMVGQVFQVSGFVSILETYPTVEGALQAESLID